MTILFLPPPIYQVINMNIRLSNMKRELLEIYTKALDSLSPGKLVTRALSEIREKETVTSRAYYFFAVGKAAVPMAEAAEEWLKGSLKRAIIISPEDHPNRPGITFFKGTHPLPDRKSQVAARGLIQFIEEIPPQSTVIALLSGGTSSLIVSPAGNIAIEELRIVFDLLNTSGATIREINTVRKHLSKIKGGQLLRHFVPGVDLVNLVISDVPGDDLQIIGSGPTVANSSSFDDAYGVLLQYELWKKLPESVRTHIQRGLNGEAPETPGKDGDGLLQPDSHIIGSAKKLAAEIAKGFERRGYHVRVADRAYSESAESLAAGMASEAKRIAEESGGISTPVVLIYYGESTVKVTGSGSGGRNQELALHAALAVEGYPSISWLSIGTDGIDGNTDAAGAFINGATIPLAEKKGVDASSYLQNNDSYHFHKKMDTLVTTGPTGNNLMDIQIVVIDETSD